MHSFENRVEQFYKRQGWQVVRAGWPDFLVYKEGLLPFCIEAKGPKDWVRPHQAKIHELLLKIGLPTLIVTPDNLGANVSLCAETRHSILPEIALCLEINHLTAVRNKLQQDIEKLNADYEGKVEVINKGLQHINSFGTWLAGLPSLSRRFPIQDLKRYVGCLEKTPTASIGLDRHNQVVSKTYERKEYEHV